MVKVFCHCGSLMLLIGLLIPNTLRAWEWAPSEEEILKYRRSWNPMAHGPMLISSVDISPKGQFLFHPFVFAQTGHQQFGNHLTTNSADAPVHLSAVAPLFLFGYGITDHLEIEGGFSPIMFWGTKPSPTGGRENFSETGMGDSQIYMKYRPIIQDPDSWRPSLTTFHQITIPTSQYFGTEKIPGGFSPLGRLPATRFGALSFTEGLLARKNLRPFRISAGVFYTYSTPGSTAGMNTYAGDIINTRLIIEHLLSDSRGLGYSLEFVTLHGLPRRLDGHPVNVAPSSFSLFGVQPTIEYKFTPQFVGAAGVLFTIAGQNNVDAIYPNFSLYYYWSNVGKVMMR